MKHKFINKKAGAEARVIAMYLDSDGAMQVDGYDTVEDLMDDYAAYEEYNPPKEPLIKDEKIRKAVRAWAKMNMLEKVEVEPPTIDCAIITFSYGMLRIDFYLGRSDISDGKYTIEELCGEGEE